MGLESFRRYRPISQIRRQENAINLRPNGSAADLPVGNGPINLGGGAGAAGPKTCIFDVFDVLGVAPWDPGKVKIICFKTLSFILT